MFPPNQIIRYEPVVSDVSDEKLINTVEVLEKSENVVPPSPSNVSNGTRSQRSMFEKPKSSEIYKFNPIRSVILFHLVLGLSSNSLDPGRVSNQITHLGQLQQFI